MPEVPFTGDTGPALPADDTLLAPPPESFLESLMHFALPPVQGKPSKFESVARRIATVLAPQDPAEEMLVAQMVATCYRGLRLARDATVQSDPKWAELHYNHADRAFNLFRRQFQTLSDYRRPRSSSFTAIRNANFAAQQVIQSIAGPGPAPDHPPAPAPAASDPVGPRRKAPPVDPTLLGEADEPAVLHQAQTEVQAVQARPRKPASRRP
jgi:hypothetical protein